MLKKNSSSSEVHNVSSECPTIPNEVECSGLTTESSDSFIMTTRNNFSKPTMNVNISFKSCEKSLSPIKECVVDTILESIVPSPEKQSHKRHCEKIEGKEGKLVLFKDWGTDCVGD